MDFYNFYTGHEFEADQWLGAHITEGGTVFRTFAPSAAGVCLLLQGKEYPMHKVHDGNFYEIFLPGTAAGALYEYRIYQSDGQVRDHCDPFGFGMELRPAHKSVVRDLDAYQFSDHSWMQQRTDRTEEPLNIYELHLGSWKKKISGTEKDNAGTEWYRYDELPALLIPYLKEAGYNYIEILPITEHPCDESWGYQPTGFYAPTSRYGTSANLQNMVDLFHQAGIGVLLDFVPVHFAVDDYALVQYDGTALFEYPHSDVGVSEWGSYNFMHSRGEVRSFLQSCANYWLKTYHFDGLRMDAISRILYWQGDERRGVNGNAVDFMKTMNSGIKRRNPGCILIAEDSTNYPGVTKPAGQGCLGFDYKWDMGWMHDTLDFFRTGPEYRTANYHKLTFSMMYFSNERYLLPFSHDEVVHGKATILQKMYGEYDKKFPQGRVLYLYMMLHPGKKLNFMGNEFGQLREWDEKRAQDWLLRKYPIHDAFYHYMARLNHLYLTCPAFYAWDYRPEGFTWLDCHQEERCIYAIRRLCGEDCLIGILNLSDSLQEDFRIPADALSPSEQPEPRLLLHTDWEPFGGKTKEDTLPWRQEEGSFYFSLPPFSGILLSV